MKVCILDIEGNNLLELQRNLKGDISKEVTKIWCIATKDLQESKPRLWLIHQLSEFTQYIKQFPVLVGHNILGYDYPVMKKLLLGLAKPLCICDTLVISKLMYPDIIDHPLGGNSLENWGTYLKIPKIAYGGGFDSYTPDMGTYCLQDVLIAEAIYLKQKDFINKNKELLKFEHDITAILNTQTETGFGYDISAGISLSVSLLQRKAEIEDDLRRSFPPIVSSRISEKTKKPLKDLVEVFNPGSRTQIAKRFHLKYEWVAPVTDKGNVKVDEEVLVHLVYPEAKLLVEYLGILKQLSQIEDWNSRATHSRDGRIHGTVNAQGAATGRCTHSQPNMAQVSGNPHIRSLWVSGQPDYVLVGADLKGLELRMLAHYMAKYDGGAYGEVLINGDIHTHNMNAAGLPSRDLAKSFIYAYLYGASNTKLAKVLSCSYTKVTQLRDRFQQEIPALSKVQDEVKFRFNKHKTLILPDNRIIPVRKEYSALNTLLQGAGAIVSKYWMKFANDLLQQYPEVKQVAYIHDELQYICPRNIQTLVGETLQTAAVMAGKHLSLGLAIEANYKVGTSWADTH